MKLQFSVLNQYNSIDIKLVVEILGAIKYPPYTRAAESVAFFFFVSLKQVLARYVYFICTSWLVLWQQIVWLHSWCPDSTIGIILFRIPGFYARAQDGEPPSLSKKEKEKKKELCTLIFLALFIKCYLKPL